MKFPLFVLFQYNDENFQKNALSLFEASFNFAREKRGYYLAA